MRQVSDVTVLDYVVGNEDREEKNWFSVPDAAAPVSGQRIVPMDNGWAFIGRGYRTSVCSTDDTNLLCPPLLRHLSGSSRCGAASSLAGPQTADAMATGLDEHAVRMQFSSAKMHNCRFRRETIEAVRVAVGSASAHAVGLHQTDDDGPGGAHGRAVPAEAGQGTWNATVRAEWLRLLAGDPLIAWLTEQYGPDLTIGKAAGGGRGARGQSVADAPAYSVALARYVHGCPRPASLPAAVSFTDAADLLTHAAAPGSTSRSAAKTYLLDWLAVGVERRMSRLLRHVATCVREFGEETVYL